MRGFEDHSMEAGREGLIFLLGVAGGVTIGLLLARRVSGSQGSVRHGEFGNRTWLRTGRRFPARFQRRGDERRELILLEDGVLDVFLEDPVLGNRGIDVGAISPGIVELSGSVRTEDEAEHAVRLASAQAGVRTIVNRLDVDAERSAERRGSRASWRRAARRPDDTEPVKDAAGTGDPAGA